jgi:polysaccharide pyruvyl transferase WcaK-like protein
VGWNPVEGASVNELEQTAKSAEKRIALWGAWYGSHNVGDQAVLIGIARILQRTLGAVHITVFTDDSAHVLDYAPSGSGCRISALDSRRQFPRVLQSLAHSDLFVIGGGVPFFQNPRHLLVMATLVGAAKAFRTPYMTWAVASQQVSSPAAKRLFRWVLDGAAAVTCRDLATRRLFESCGLDSTVDVVADPVLSLAGQPESSSGSPPRLIGNRDAERPLAALIPRGLRRSGGSSGIHYGGQTSGDIARNFSCFAAALDWLWTHGYQPVFVPMNTVAPDDDREAARAIIHLASYGDRALRVDEAVRPLTVPALLRRCRLAMTARVHGSIMAMLANCPIVMYAFDVKHRGIMESMGLAPYVLDSRTADPAETSRLLDDLTDDLDGVRRFMREKLTVLEEDAMAPGRLARRIVTGARGDGADPHRLDSTYSVRSDRSRRRGPGPVEARSGRARPGR